MVLGFRNLLQGFWHHHRTRFQFWYFVSGEQSPYGLVSPPDSVSETEGRQRHSEVGRPSREMALPRPYDEC